MNRLPLIMCAALAAIVVTSFAAAAATLEYTFSVPYDLKPAPGAGPIGPGRALNVTCAMGPASLSYSTATGAAQNSTASGTTQNVTKSPAVVVVTVDAEPRATGAAGVKAGAGANLQPVQANGYYTCWGTFASGQTPVNFLPTTKLPAATPAL